MKRQMILASLLMSYLPFIAFAQSSMQGQGSTKETQARGYWSDPSTGLMWAGKDNGKDVSWKNAMKYCRNLRLSDHSDWRLATAFEMAQIYDKNVEAPGLSGPGKESPNTWHVKGNLFLTGYEWGSNRIPDDRGKPSGYAWYFNFNDGQPDQDPTGWPYPYSFRRALCVRGGGE